MIIAGPGGYSTGKVYSIKIPGGEAVTITNQTSYYLKVRTYDEHIIPPFMRFCGVLGIVEDRATVEVMEKATGATMTDGNIEAFTGPGMPGLYPLAQNSMFKQQGEILS